MEPNSNEKTEVAAVAPGVDALTQALAEPFEPQEVHFKPQVVSGNRAMAVAYVDARVIQDRLDEVLGVTGWQDEYEVLPDGGWCAGCGCTWAGSGSPRWTWAGRANSPTRATEERRPSATP